MPSYCLIDESGELCCEMQEVLDVVQSHDLVLATGHITHKETFALARVASKRGFRKLLITHADWEFTHYTVEEQQELVKLEHGLNIHILLLKKGVLPGKRWPEKFGP